MSRLSVASQSILLNACSSNNMAKRVLRRKADALQLDNPDLWGVRVSIADGPWYQLFHPQVQHLAHSSALPQSTLSELGMDIDSDEQDMSLNGDVSGRFRAPQLHHHRAIQEGYGDDANYWMHAAHDDVSMTEMIFRVPRETLDEAFLEPLRWRVGDPRPCVVQLVLRLPMHEPYLRDSNVLMEFTYSMDFTAYALNEKPHHYMMALLADDHTAELEFHSRLDQETRSGFYYHPTQFTLQMRTDVLVYVMASHNPWFMKYMQGLGVLPQPG